MIRNYIIFFSLFILSMFSVKGVEKNWRCINEKGETVFSLNAERVFPFQNGLAKVYKTVEVDGQKDKLYGYVDKKGTVVIPFKYERASDFFGEVTWVKKPGDKYFSLVNTQGQIVPTENKYERVANFYEWQTDLSAVYQGQKMGFVNTKGEEVIPCEFMGRNFFSEGLVCVKKEEGEKYGFINKKGDVVIPFELDAKGMTKFENGRAVTQKNGVKVVINKQGEVIFSTQKGTIEGISGNRVLVHKGEGRSQWGWLNLKDEWVIEPVYEQASDFNESNIAAVKKGGLYGLINDTGAVILDFKYKNIYFNVKEDGFISAVYPSPGFQPLLEAETDYFDADLNLLKLEDIKFIYPAGGQELMMFLDPDKKIGFLNRSFEKVISPEYEKAKPFSEGLAWVVK